ncbi:MAG: nuclease A inhibitor family protein [Stenomitos frigidus ULC029]
MMLSDTLEQASQGLLMPSESDYPFETFIWSGQAGESLTPKQLLQLTGHPPETPVESVDLEYLFRNLTQPQEWHDTMQQANVVKFQTLMQTLKANLSDLQVYRVGSIEIEVYIVGKNDDDLAGLKTKLIET